MIDLFLMTLDWLIVAAAYIIMFTAVAKWIDRRRTRYRKNGF